jgi:hypothetical protein
MQAAVLGIIVVVIAVLYQVRGAGCGCAHKSQLRANQPRVPQLILFVPVACPCDTCAAFCCLHKVYACAMVAPLSSLLRIAHQMNRNPRLIAGQDLTLC